MSINDAEILGLSAVGYDEFAISEHDDITDSYLLADNRAYMTGEVPDRLYPLSTFRGGWDTDGSGIIPDIHDVGTYASQISSPIAPNPPGRNINVDRNRAKRGSGTYHRKRYVGPSITGSNGPTIGEIAREKLRAKKAEKLNEGGERTGPPTLGEWWRGLWTPDNMSSNLITLVFILMITIVALQVFHTQRIYRMLNMLMVHSIPGMVPTVTVVKKVEPSETSE